MPATTRSTTPSATPRSARTLLRSGLLGLLGLLGLFPAGCSDPEGLPDDREAFNLILISLDTCRRDRLSVYGGGKTPCLDAFAAEAVRFEDCISQSGITGPSHLSLLTGQFVHRHGLSENGMRQFPPYTMASVLADRGWQTAAFTGHGFFQEEYGHATGFDTFESWIGEPPTDYPFWRDVADVVPSALAWLDDHQDDPFFLVVHGYDPHQPYYPPDPWRTHFAGWYEGKLDTRRMRSPQYRKKIRKGRFGEDEFRYINDLYDAEVAHADDVLGGFLDELRDRELLDRSIVVFTSDHGEALGNQGHVGHGAVLDDVLEIPLLIRFPEGRYAAVLDAPTMSIDLLPTLLSALGVVAPEGLQGENLLPWIRGEAEGPEAERMRVSQTKVTYAVHFGERWKITARFKDDTIQAQGLWDLIEDPHEDVNLYHLNEEGEAKYDELLDRFLKWRAETSADDLRFRGKSEESNDPESDLRLLEALGYVGDDGSEGDDASEDGEAGAADGDLDAYDDYEDASS